MTRGTILNRVLQSALLLAMASAVFPAPRDREAAERRLAAELAARHPEAVAVWLDANATRARGDHPEAVRLYARVAELAPDFAAATRRLAGEKLALNQKSEAIALARQALSMEASAPSRVMLALALAREVDDRQPSRAELREAMGLVALAAQQEPEDAYTQAALCHVAAANNDLVRFKQGVERLLTVAPHDVSTHQFAAVLAASEGRTADARTELQRARELGMAEEQYQALGRAIAEKPSLARRPLALLGWGGAVWLCALLVLFVLGVCLSRAVLRAAEHLPRQASGGAQSGGTLRRIYGVVLWLSCAYYYVSLPIIALVVLVAGGGIVYAMLSVGRIPVKLLVLVVVITLGTLWAILKSLFVRGRDDDPGTRIDLRTNPRLGALLRDVARRVDTRAVDSVYLTPGTEVAVMERGGLGQQLRGRAERCLILGIGILEGLRIGPFKAVLAHEYGHFSNRDTAGGGFALSVRRSLLTMARSLAESGSATWYNPAWLFVNAFYRAFLRISQGASRWQEVLADRWAAFTYGSKAFEDGLRHVIEQSVRFEARANRTLQEMIEQRRSVTNLYAHQPETPVPESDVAEAIRAVLNHPPSPYDSHPSPVERTRWVRSLAAKGTVFAPEDEAEVWTLFTDRKTIEENMTSSVQLAVLRVASAG